MIIWLHDVGVTHLIAALASLSGRMSANTINQQQLASNFVTRAIVRVALANMVRIDQVLLVVMRRLSVVAAGVVNGHRAPDQACRGAAALSLPCE